MDLKESRNWKPKTKLILHFTDPPPTLDPYKPILKNFSSESITQVVAIHYRNGKFLGIYHSPFEPNPKLAFTICKVQPNSIGKCFPDKVRNHNGHKFDLFVYPNPPWTIFRNNTLTGLNRYFWDIVMKQWNATYKVTTVQLDGMMSEFPNLPVTHLIANKFPFVNSVANSFDMVSAKSSYNLGILITSRRIECPWKLMKIYFSPLYLLVNIPVVFTTVVLFNRFILQRRGIHLFEFNDLAYLYMYQSANFEHIRGRKLARIFVATVLSYCFFMVSILTCFLTSQMVAYIPDENIRTIDQLMQVDMEILTEFQMKFFVIEEGFGLPKGFEKRIRVSNLSLWSLEETRPKTAYIVDMELQKYFLESATNLNAYGRAKYYELDHLIVSLPFFYILPHNSPYADHLEKILSNVDAAGLMRYWLTMEFRPHNVPHYKQFPSETKNIQSVLQSYKQLKFIFAMFGIGLGISAIVFIGEILVHYCRKRREP